MTEEGPEKWVRDAIAEQEEHIKRTRSCSDILGLSHLWKRYTTKGGGHFWACSHCGVTRSAKDYARKLGEE